MWNTGLPPGDHSYVVYDGGSAIGTDTLTVEQLEWSFTSVQMVPMGGGFAITGWATVPWCGTSALNAPCCMPDPATTYIRLLQDGITEIATMPCVACDDFPCYGTSFMFLDVPGGHTYQVRLHDDACGNVVTDTTIFEVPLVTAVAEEISAHDVMLAQGASPDELILLVNGGPVTDVHAMDLMGRQVPTRTTLDGRILVGGLPGGHYLIRGLRDGRVYMIRYARP